MNENRTSDPPETLGLYRRGGGSIGPAPQKPAGHVLQALDATDEHLTAAIDHLEQCLAPILTPPHPTAAADNAKAETPIENLVQKLANHPARIASLIQRIRL